MRKLLILLAVVAMFIVTLFAIPAWALPTARAAPTFHVSMALATMVENPVYTVAPAPAPWMTDGQILEALGAPVASMAPAINWTTGNFVVTPGAMITQEAFIDMLGNYFDGSRQHSCLLGPMMTQEALNALETTDYSRLLGLPGAMSRNTFKWTTCTFTRMRWTPRSEHIDALGPGPLYLHLSADIAAYVTGFEFVPTAAMEQRTAYGLSRTKAIDSDIRLIAARSAIDANGVTAIILRM